MELSSEISKLSKRIHPDPDSANRYSVEVFFRLIDPALSRELQKLGLEQLDDIVAAARRIENLLDPSPAHFQSMMETMQKQIGLLTQALQEQKHTIKCVVSPAPTSTPEHSVAAVTPSPPPAPPTAPPPRTQAHAPPPQAPPPGAAAIQYHYPALPTYQAPPPPHPYKPDLDTFLA